MTFLIGAVTLFLLVLIIIAAVGWRAKSNENLILCQSLPVTWMYAFLYGLFFLSEALFPGQDEYGYGIGFIVMLPSVAMAVLAITLLGVAGLMRIQKENDTFLAVTSVGSASVIFTFIFTQFLFPLLTLYIVALKAVRKYRKRNSH